MGVFFIGEGAEAGNQWASLRVRGIVRSVRNRSDRLTINWVSARFPHPALRATFPPGEGFLGARRETKEGGRSVIVPTGAVEL